MFDFGILWNNARNLQFIKKFNPRKTMRLADNKLMTKEFLEQRWIPVPKTYWIIESRKQLYEFDFSEIQNNEFVVKPNRWSKWQWVNIVKLLDEKSELVRNNINILNKISLKDFFSFYATKNSNLYYKIWKEIYNDEWFRRILTDIVDWKYSLSFGNDSILIEEKIIPWEWFARYCNYWLADIRVIVFNLIPVAWMIRVPTAWSWWKANLAQWWIWLWVEVWSGKVKSIYYKWKIFSKNFPWDFSELYLKKINFWNDILLFSSRIQYFVNVWYLALDWVITEEWPKLLEINARAWLEVQNACFLPLKKRLNKIGDIKIKDPEKWVEICKSLFTSAKSNIITMSKILYLSQRWKLILEHSEKDDIIQLVVKVDVCSERNLISRYLYSKIKEHKGGDVILDLYENEIRFKNLKYSISNKIDKDVIILWKNSVEDCYIRPINKVYSDIKLLNWGSLIEEEKETIHFIDQKLEIISLKLSLWSILKPLNYFDELDNFLTWHGNYNPKFVYKWPDDLKLQQLEDELNQIQEKNFSNELWLKSKFAYLFKEKIEELFYRIKLIRAYKSQDYDNILNYNHYLYGVINDELIDLSKNKIFIDKYNDKSVLWKELSFNQIKRHVKSYLDEKNISWVKILVDSSSLSRISIRRWKNIQIRLSSTSKFRENEIKSLLVHEIDIHLIRYLNGLDTWWEIFKSGTGYYLKHEEGLAVYKSFTVLPDDYEKRWIYEKYYLISQASVNNFVRLAGIVRWIKECSLINSFRSALRIKKWIENTSFINKWAIYLKDKIYLEWYLDIKSWVDNWWDIDKLLVWKIKLNDLDYI